MCGEEAGARSYPRGGGGWYLGIGRGCGVRLLQLQPGLQQQPGSVSFHPVVLSACFPYGLITLRFDVFNAWMA